MYDVCLCFWRQGTGEMQGMNVKEFIEGHDDRPLYNTKAVVKMTGIPASTLRAWERRYNILSPRRTSKAYRLYSERDIAMIRWLQQQLDSGMTIGQASVMLNAINEGSIESHAAAAVKPEFHPTLPGPHSLEQPIGSLAELADRFYDACMSFDEQAAEDIVDVALVAHPVDAVCHNLLAETLVRLGEGWHQGQVSTTVEHFATAFVRGKLIALLNLQPLNNNAPLVIVACPAEEQHEIGALLAALFLRWQGFRVIYLGQNTPTGDLLVMIVELHPAMVCMSAMTDPTAHKLVEFSQQLARLDDPPLFAFGGGAFNRHPQLRDYVRGEFLGEDVKALAMQANNALLRRLKQESA